MTQHKCRYGRYLGDGIPWERLGTEYHIIHTELPPHLPPWPCQNSKQRMYLKEHHAATLTTDDAWMSSITLAWTSLITMHWSLEQTKENCAGLGIYRDLCNPTTTWAAHSKLGKTPCYAVEDKAIMAAVAWAALGVEALFGTRSSMKSPYWKFNR